MTSPARTPLWVAFWISVFAATADRTHGATIVAGPGESGLRAAIAAAQSGDIVVVTGRVELAASVTLSKPVSITGRSNVLTTVVIKGTFDGELFHIVTNQVAFQWLTFDGSAQTDGLRVDGEVALRDCTLTRLRNPTVHTGWFLPDAYVRLERVTVTANSNGLEAQHLEATNCIFSYNDGGGAFAQEGVYDKCTFEYNQGYGLGVIHATVKNSVFRHNAGLGLLFDPDQGRLVLESCLFYANVAGGILLREEAYATVDNCTFTRHTGRPAIMVTEAHDVLFRHCTVVDNVVTDPGTSPWYPDGGAFALEDNGRVELQNCLVAENPTSDDPDASGMSGSWIDGGGNVIGGAAQLGVLRDNGGPTMTLLPLPGSPAIDAGEPTEVGTDARGLSRLAGNAPDAGATETDATAIFDSDGDGLPDSWELFHSLNPAQSLDAGSDNDLDGQNALAEFHAHTDPNNASSLLRITDTFIHIDDTSHTRHATLRWTPAPGATYQVEISNNLREWRRAPGNVFGGVRGLEFSGPSAAPAAFYRIRVQ